MSETTLIDLQTDLKSRLEADAYFVDIPVVTEREGEIVATINQALGVLTEKGGKVGACVVIMSPVGDDDYPNVAFGPLQVQLTARVLENVVVNTGATGTGKAALAIARRVHRVLKHYLPVGLAQVLVADKPSLVPVEDPFAQVAYEVRFRTAEADKTAYTKVAMPTITPESGAAPQTVTLASATAGASIYYTLDGTHPWSGNGGAVLYSGPINVASAAVLRAAAFKSGLVGSDVNRGDYT